MFQFDTRAWSVHVDGRCVQLMGHCAGDGGSDVVSVLVVACSLWRL